MKVKQCDICGKIQEEMENFILPIRGYKKVEIVTENGFGYQDIEGYYPFDVDLCDDCKNKIGEYIESIKGIVEDET